MIYLVKKMIARISDLFYINQGHQITDEEIYNGNGNIPVYTSSNIIKGYNNNSLVKKEELPCLTYQTKGYSGVISVQKSLFNANNTAVLIIKPKFKKIINLQYIALLLNKEFKNILTSESGVSYLNKDLVSKIELKLLTNTKGKIDIDLQNKFIDKYNEIIKYKKTIENKIININNIMNHELNIENYQVITMEKIALLNKGSNKISEENIYNNFKKDGIPVYSSATINEGLMGTVSQDFFNNSNKQGKASELTWTTNGYAGVVFYRETDYLYSEKCGRIILRNNYQEIINPKYLKIYLNQITYKYKTAESNNGKLDILHMSNIPVKLPINIDGKIDINIQNLIVGKYEKLLKIKINLEKILLKCNDKLNI